MIGIFTHDDVRLGTVAKFVGHPARERWVAWSTAEPGGSGHRFPTKRAAVAWLVEVAAKATPDTGDVTLTSQSPKC